MVVPLFDNKKATVHLGMIQPELSLNDLKLCVT